MSYVRRRAVLRAGSVGLGTVFVGCIGAQQEPRSENQPGQRYEECDWIRISYARFPDDIRREIDAAMADGQYEADHLSIEEAIDTDAAYVVVDHTPYELEVSDRNGSRVLRLNEVDTVRLPEPRYIVIENDDVQNQRGTLNVTTGEGLQSAEFDLEPGDVTRIPLTDEFGTHQLHIETDGDPGFERTQEIVVDDYNRDARARIHEDGIRVVQMVVDPAPCSWEE